MCKQIELTQGYSAIVDDDDYVSLSRFKWQYSDGYAKRIERDGAKRRAIYMHREVARPIGNLVVDHINGNRLDNRKRNLRLATRDQNNRNTCAHGKASRYKGVRENHGKWQASITVNGSRTHLGTFVCEKAAAQAYNDAARAAFGEFARLNVIPD